MRAAMRPRIVAGHGHLLETSREHPPVALTPARRRRRGVFTSSSTKNGLPSARAVTSATRSSGGSAPSSSDISCSRDLTGRKLTQVHDALARRAELEAGTEVADHDDRFRDRADEIADEVAVDGSTQCRS